jgi:dipeptidyl-peptidase 4
VHCKELIPPILAALFLLITAAPAERAIHNPQFLRDYAETRGFRMGAPSRPTFTPDGKALLFLRSGPRSPKLDLYEFDIDSKETRLLLTPESLLKGAEEELSPEEKARRERMRVTSRGFTDFQISKNGARILLSLSGKLYVLDRSSGKAQELKPSQGTIVDPKFSPDGKHVSYVLDHDVYAYDLEQSREVRVTEGGTADISHGLAEFVAQEEMNRFSGYWWSPDSDRLVFQESDSREVETWFVADPAKPEAAPYPTRYPRPGKANVKVRLGITPLTQKETIWFNWDRERYPYLARVSWDTNGPLTLTVETRDQRELVLLEANPTSGSTTPLVTERDAAWVNLRQDIPKWLPDDKGFIWASERSGDWQIEWRNRDGSLKEVLRTGTVKLRDISSVNETNDILLFTGAPDPTQAKLYALPLTGGPPVELTPEAGWHGARFDKSHSLMVDTLTTLQAMPRTMLRAGVGRTIAELPSVAERPSFTPRVEILQVSDRKFYAGIVRPQKFNARKRYPVIVDVYGGPLPAGSAGNVAATMPSWLLLQWLADQGFVVVAIDGRGIPGRGRDWERAVRNDFATVTLGDQAAGLKALGRKYRELDTDRAGIFGWSFGGYMSALAVLKEPKVFKAGIAGAPVTDWYDYDTHYTERYLGIPPADDAAYERSSLLPLAKNLQRPLLLIHGTSDDNVYFRHTLKLANELFRAGKHFELLPLSGFTHMVPDPVVNEQLYSRMVRFFKTHLGEPK